jgi:ABC-type branched-subunit amino acid transport system substrate-binding protein
VSPRSSSARDRCRRNRSNQFSLADAGHRGQELLHAFGRLHLAAYVEEEGSRGRDRPGSEIVGEQYFRLDHVDYGSVVADIMATGADVVFKHIAPPGLTPCLAQLYEAGFMARGGQVVGTYFDENFLNLVPAEHVEGLYGCLGYYRDVQDPFSIELLNRYEARYPGSAMFTAGSACTGTYRALKMWECAVNEAGSLMQHDVIAALDHARIPQGPGGPAEMVPRQHHVRMNMYIARSEAGTFKVVESLGHNDPKECEVPLS